jgi:hypothetical protein
MNSVLQKFGEADPAKRRQDLREGNSPEILLRRATIGASLDRYGRYSGDYLISERDDQTPEGSASEGL